MQKQPLQQTSESLRQNSFSQQNANQQESAQDTANQPYPVQHDFLSQDEFNRLYKKNLITEEGNLTVDGYMVLMDFTDLKDEKMSHKD